MIVYLAEPCDFSRGEWRDIIDTVHQDLQRKGNTVFRPAHAWAGIANGDRTDHTEVVAINRNALEGADAMVAVLPAGATSIGVPMEIGWATDAGVPVVVLTDLPPGKSVMLNGNSLVTEISHPDQLDLALRRAARRARTDSDARIRPNTVRAVQRLEEIPGPLAQEMSGNPFGRGTMADEYDFVDGTVTEDTEMRVLPFQMDYDHPAHPSQMPSPGRTHEWTRGGLPAGDAVLPRQHAGDAAFDLYTIEDVTMAAGEFMMIRCGVRVELPTDVFGWVVARSSTFPNWGIVVPPGIIDSGYRGELTVPAYRAPLWELAVGSEPSEELSSLRSASSQVIPAGTRLAQLVLIPNVARFFQSELVEKIAPAPAGDRGLAGFGSTGAAGSEPTNVARLPKEVIPE